MCVCVRRKDFESKYVNPHCKHSVLLPIEDGPFCNLRQLATELAQSNYSPVKVPSWLLSGAISVVRYLMLETVRKATTRAL
eukprot:808442-Amphidinium_carterae.1